MQDENELKKFLIGVKNNQTVQNFRAAHVFTLNDRVVDEKLDSRLNRKMRYQSRNTYQK